MAQVPNDTRFIGINPTVNLRERRSARINRETQPVSMQDITDSIRPYKVYTALLTQTGGSEEVKRSSDNPILTIGVTYWITENVGNPDFTIVGAPNNEIGTYFIATGTNPNWGEGGAELKFNTGAPVVTVLENTIGNIWFDYREVGEYSCLSDSLFTIGKTTIDIDSYGQDGNASGGSLISNTTLNPDDKFTINTYKGDYSDSQLVANRLEIRVYN
jgi:hypothetical protein